MSLENAPDAILLECGHSGICMECAIKLWGQTRRCPLCRETFAGIMRVLDEDAENSSMVPTLACLRVLANTLLGLTIMYHTLPQSTLMSARTATQNRADSASSIRIPELTATPSGARGACALLDLHASRGPDRCA